MKRKAVVIGSGAGGAMAARELQKRYNYDVMIVEAGREFFPLSLSLERFEPLRKAGLFFDERMIHLLFPSMEIRSLSEKMILVNGSCTGGTTTLATGNALRQDKALQKLGIDLDTEFEELNAELPITITHQKNWSSLTHRLFEQFEKSGFYPQILPKFMHPEKCVRCGQCVLGCKYGAKWDARDVLREAVGAGAQLLTQTRAEKLIVSNGRTCSLKVKRKRRVEIIHADLFVLAAGGVGTPMLLERSSIATEPHFFVDPVLCVAAPWKNACLDRQLPMPFAAQRDGYILSPYFDQLSFYFNKKWRRSSSDIMSLMIKLTDSNEGLVQQNYIEKSLTQEDKLHLDQAVVDCKKILIGMGVNNSEIFFGTLNAGHPGGTFPLSQDEADTLHSHQLPDNLYIADATLFPQSLGNPPILTIMALAKRIARLAALHGR